MHNYKIPSATGYPETVVYDTYANAEKIVCDRVKRHSAELENGWLTSSAAAKNKFNIENRVKFYLDCLGYLLLQASHSANQDNGITSLYKEQSKRNRELPHDFVETDFRVQKQKRPQETGDRFAYVQSQVSKYDRNAEIVYCTVDTDNVFTLHGQEYRIDESVAQYQGKRVNEDMLYDMSRIIVLIEPDGSKRFFDENFDPINEELIYLK